MIVLFLKDGFGNQLFEYAFARRLSQMYGDRIVINRIYFRRKNDRSCQLEKLALPPDVSYSGKIMSLLYLVLLELRLLLSLGPKFFLIHKDQERFNETFGGSLAIFSRCQKQGLYLSTSPYQYYDSFIPSPGRIKLVFGNFEHSSFVKDCRDTLRKELTLKSDLDVSRFVDAGESDVCVHVRRGDYLNPQWKSLNVCGREYFEKAMEHITAVHPEARFYIFSNTDEDIDWIRENYCFKGNVKYMKTGLNDVEDFFVMSACRHFILSNSTYSWWAYFLSSGESQLVLAPDVWSVGSCLSEGMYLPEFIRVKA